MTYAKGYNDGVAKVFREHGIIAVPHGFETMLDPPNAIHSEEAYRQGFEHGQEMAIEYINRQHKKTC